LELYVYFYCPHAWYTSVSLILVTLIIMVWIWRNIPMMEAETE
jgi:hypothetical protein